MLGGFKFREHNEHTVVTNHKCGPLTKPHLKKVIYVKMFFVFFYLCDLPFINLFIPNFYYSYNERKCSSYKHERLSTVPLHVEMTLLPTGRRKDNLISNNI